MSEMTTRQLLGWAWAATRHMRGRLLSVCLVGLMRVAASLTFIWLSKVIIDTATDSASTDARLWWLAAAMAGCMILEMALVQASNYLSATTNQRMANAMRQRLYAKLLSSDIYDEQRHSGDILNRLTLDVNRICDTLTVTVPSIIVMGSQLIAAFWLIVVMSPLLGLCALLITPACKLVSHFYIRRMRRLNRELRDGESLIHANIQEGLQHRVVVQTLECAPQMHQRLADLQSAVMDSVTSRARLSLVSRSAMRAGIIAGYMIAFVWCIFGLHSGAITYGMMTAFLQLVARIQNPISSLSSLMPNILDTATAIERLHDLSGDDALAQSGPSPQKDTCSPAGVRFSDVTYGYNEDEPVLEHLTYDFAPGSRTVIMGETGVGKSTLTKLILALMRPQSGVIEVYTPKGAERVSAGTRCYMTYVPQGNSLMQGTVRDNLLLGNPQADDTAMREALHTAVADFVYDMPLGLDTPCGELGSGLSEGQCQRIAIARALLRDAPVLILDEFNSSLDQTTARALIERLDAARPEATIIYISHRPEVTQYCDNILHLTYNT